jgi:hypothetical protein
MPIDGVAASRSAIRYIDAVSRFKLAVRNGEISKSEFKKKQKRYEEFYAEGRGQRKGRRSSEIDYLSRHGEIVDELRKWRGSNPMPSGARIVKDILIDMGVAVENKLIEVFEVKTSAARQYIYSALGQLMVHGTSNGCRRVMVLPRDESLADDLVEALARLNVELLRFKLGTKRITILNTRD